MRTINPSNEDNQNALDQTANEMPVGASLNHGTVIDTRRRVDRWLRERNLIKPLYGRGAHFHQLYRCDLAEIESEEMNYEERNVMDENVQ